MSRIHVSHSKFALFTIGCASACFAGSFLATRIALPGVAHARVEKPLVSSVPDDGEVFVGPAKHTLVSIREDGLGANVVVYDAQGHPISIADLATRVSRLEGALSACTPKEPSVDRSFR